MEGNNAEFANNRNKTIEHIYDLDNLKIKAYWWKSVKEIKLPTNKEYLRPDHFVFLHDIPIRSIIENLESRNKLIYAEKRLYQPKLESKKTNQIIEFWTKKKKLIPPYLFRDGLNQFEIHDGRHRLNVAFCLNEECIPIITTVEDYIFVAERLGYI